jgi:hypothetical protein
MSIFMDDFFQSCDALAVAVRKSELRRALAEVGLPYQVSQHMDLQTLLRLACAIYGADFISHALWHMTQDLAALFYDREAGCYRG